MHLKLQTLAGWPGVIELTSSHLSLLGSCIMLQPLSPFSILTTTSSSLGSSQRLLPLAVVFAYLTPYQALGSVKCSVSQRVLSWLPPTPNPIQITCPLWFLFYSTLYFSSMALNTICNCGFICGLYTRLFAPRGPDFFLLIFPVNGHLQHLKWFLAHGQHSINICWTNNWLYLPPVPWWLPPWHLSPRPIWYAVLVWAALLTSPSERSSRTPSSAFLKLGLLSFLSNPASACPV